MGKEKKKSKERVLHYDVVIIGAGGTGLAAGMYCGRLGLKTLVLGTTSGMELPIGGVITTTHVVENYPGFIRLTGPELAKKLEEHARDYKIDIHEERVLRLERKKEGFVTSTDKNTYSSSTIIYATGTKWRKLGVPGEDKFANKGVSYCALCDGPLFLDKIVAVVGGSDSATKESLLLAEYAKKVYIIARGGKLRAEPINLERALRNKKIEIIVKTNVLEMKGKDFLTFVILDNPYQGKKELPVDGVFVEIGHVPLSDLAKSAGVALNEKGEVIIDKESRTNVPGLFAAGDVVDTEFKQLITGVGEAVKAAYHAYKFVQGREIHPVDDKSLGRGHRKGK